MDDSEPIGDRATSRPDPRSLKVFISYRRGPRGDAARATLLHEALARRLGTENVFFDIPDVKGGEDFVKAINARVAGCDVLIAVIGPNWVKIADEKDFRLLFHEQDWVRLEIEAALKRRPPVHIIPLLVDGAAAVDWRELPRPMKALATRNARTLHHESWADDVDKWLDHLLEEIPAIVRELEAAQREQQRPVARRAKMIAAPGESEKRYSPPDEEHFDEVAKWIARGNVVTFLGPEINGSDRDEPWQENSGYLPAGDELARYIAEKVGFDFPDTTRLAAVSEYALVAEDDHNLYQKLKAALDPPRPTSVHRFLAALPRRLEELAIEHRYQVIVTSNYDGALEQAFEDAQEDFHLAVYMASGRNAGKFLHVPYDQHVGRIVADPSTYSDFGIGDDFAVRRRSVIVKIQGALKNPPVGGDEYVTGGDFSANYVLTEDHHIDFLSQMPVANLIPQGLLLKLMWSRRLFLGYPIADWSTRNLLHRLWGGQETLDSWAVDGRPYGDRERWRLDRKLWRECGVELHSMRLADYTSTLDAALDAYATGRVSA